VTLSKEMRKRCWELNERRQTRKMWKKNADVLPPTDSGRRRPEVCSWL
jgi:hypothetical protein